MCLNINTMVILAVKKIRCFCCVFVVRTQSHEKKNNCPEMAIWQYIIASSRSALISQSRLISTREKCHSKLIVSCLCVFIREMVWPYLYVGVIVIAMIPVNKLWYLPIKWDSTFLYRMLLSVWVSSFLYPLLSNLTETFFYP